MVSIFDPENAPPTKEEIEAALKVTTQDLHFWKKRTVSSGLAFFLACVALYPFLYGHPLHAHWDFGKYLIFASMGLLVVFTYCGGMLLGTWFCLRDIKKDARAAAQIMQVEKP